MKQFPPLTRAARWIGVVLFGVLLTGPSDVAHAINLRAFAISDELDGISEFRPRIAGASIAWQRGSGAGSEVMRWDGTQAVNLTMNGVADEDPETDGIHIIWQHSNGAQHDIGIYDLVTRSTTFLNSAGDEISPVISGAYIAWVRLVDADGEVFIDPGPLGNQLTGNELVERELAFDGSNLVWSQGDELQLTPSTSDDTHDIAVWNGDLQELYLLGGNPTDDIRPSIAADTIVWQAGPDGSGDIWYGDTQGTANVLFDGTDERNPTTDGIQVIWEHHDGVDLDLYRVNLASPNSSSPFTADSVDDVMPQIGGGNVVWVKKVAAGDSEIWFSWHGDPPEPLRRTQGNGRDDVAPSIDGDYFVYESCINLGQPSELCDVILAPEPRTTALVAVALLTLGGLASRSARRAVPVGKRSRPS